MTNFKQYFRLHLKENVRNIICILVSVLTLTFLIAISADPEWRSSPVDGTELLSFGGTLYVPTVFIAILVYILPFMEFSIFKKRINLDCLYALPISRRTMGLVHYLTGLIVLFGVFTISHLFNFILLLSRGLTWYNPPSMIVHYFLCLLFGFAMYSIMSFVFNEANTKGDGIWFMILYTFVFMFLICTIENKVGIRNSSVDSYLNHENWLPWIFFAQMTISYWSFKLGSADVSFWLTQENVIVFVFWIIVGVASAIGLFLTFGKRRMELTEEQSDSFFGFRVLLPIYAICGMLLCGGLEYIFFTVIIELFTIFGYTIYRRGFHYKKSDIAVMLLLLIFLFL